MIIRIVQNKNGAGALLAAALAPALAMAQSATTESEEKHEDVVVLSPFEVSAEQQSSGYSTATTLAGNRLNTDLKDLGTSLSVYNTQFLKDIGATDNQSLLKYTLGTEIGGVNGNYSGSGGGTSPDRDSSYLNPQSTNRVRGLISADSTRDLYLSSIPWDGYNIDAVDLQRGPNAILFGQGSPGGVINTRTKQATFRNQNEVTMRVDQYGSLRGTLDINRVLLKDEMALRFAAVDSEGKFKQKPAFEDFNREYLAFRYEPKYLKKGIARTIIKADAEIGRSTSNRPRNMPPGDHITPWFTDLNKQLYNVAYMNDNHWELPGRGAVVQSRTNADNQTEQNPNYQPWLNTNFGNNYYGGSEFFFLPGTTTPALSLAINPVSYLGVNSLGERDGSIGGLAPSQPHGIQGYRNWAMQTNQPFATLAKDRFITDPSIFDFYNNLIDGDIKREWSDFHTFDVSLSQTFFDDSMGFDVGYHNESYTSGSYSPLIGEGGSIFVDYNSVWPDGTNASDTGWYSDGTKNPGAGRAFVQLGNGTGEGTTERKSFRATAFISHDFSRGEKDSWWRRLLGTQTATGVAVKDDYDSTSRNWVNSAFTGSYYLHPQFASTKQANGRFWADFVPIRTVYLSDSLTGKTLGQNLGIKYPGADPVLPDTVKLRYFDSTWNATGVNPADPWYNQASAGTAAGPALSTQSENPLNYVGWVTKDVQLLRATNATNRELLTTDRSWDDRTNKAYAFVWQGKFWDDSIIGTAGIRKDEVSQVLTAWNNNNSSDRSTGDPTLVTPTVSEFGPLKRRSKSWGAVTHINRLPWISGVLKNFPLDVSATYNRSDNFQTGQIYRDYFGQQLPLPEGSTKDMGVVLATKNGRYTLRINKFESAIKNTPSTFIAWWTWGNNIGIMASAYHQIKYNYETRGNPNSQRYGSGIVSDLPVPTDANPNPKWNFDYAPLAGQTLEQAQAQEVAVINAWDQWLQEMGPLPQIMAKAWGFSWDQTYSGSDVSNFRLTSDLVSKGYEFELNAEITDEWRLSVNASRIESIIDNIGKTPAPGGKITVIDYLMDFDRRMNETAMGDLRIWGPGGSATARENWAGAADGELKARLAEQGTVVPENRLWHINVITNYDFKHGALKGWSLGGAARYQSSSILGYKPVQNTNYISYDLNSPYRDDAEINFDLWVGYNRKLFRDKIHWRVQLNVSNVGVGDELIPVTVQPDGTPAAYRIRPPQQVFLTNTFNF
ncbi:TonB-dependent receptor [Opitutaceae bacterium EW11]|nr:TonB-dependent receptor [Opitutaceae bacterium EW11]